MASLCPRAVRGATPNASVSKSPIPEDDYLPLQSLGSTMLLPLAWVVREQTTKFSQHVQNVCFEEINENSRILDHLGFA